MHSIKLVMSLRWSAGGFGVFLLDAELHREIALLWKSILPFYLLCIFMSFLPSLSVYSLLLLTRVEARDGERMSSFSPKSWFEIYQSASKKKEKKACASILGKALWTSGFPRVTELRWALGCCQALWRAWGAWSLLSSVLCCLRPLSQAQVDHCEREMLLLTHRALHG